MLFCETQTWPSLFLKIAIYKHALYYFVTINVILKRNTWMNILSIKDIQLGKTIRCICHALQCVTWNIFGICYVLFKHCTHCRPQIFGCHKYYLSICPYRRNHWNTHTVLNENYQIAIWCGAEYSCWPTLRLNSNHSCTSMKASDLCPICIAALAFFGAIDMYCL